METPDNAQSSIPPLAYFGNPETIEYTKDQIEKLAKLFASNSNHAFTVSYTLRQALLWEMWPELSVERRACFIAECLEDFQKVVLGDRAEICRGIVKEWVLPFLQPLIAAQPGRVTIELLSEAKRIAELNDLQRDALGLA